jgi:hypothetical protein
MITHFDMPTGAVIDMDGDNDDFSQESRFEPMPILRLLSVTEADSGKPSARPTPAALLMLPVSRLIGD